MFSWAAVKNHSLRMGACRYLNCPHKHPPGCRYIGPDLVLRITPLYSNQSFSVHAWVKLQGINTLHHCWWRDHHKLKASNNFWWIVNCNCVSNSKLNQTTKHVQRMLITGHLHSKIAVQEIGCWTKGIHSNWAYLQELTYGTLQLTC